MTCGDNRMTVQRKLATLRCGTQHGDTWREFKKPGPLHTHTHTDSRSSIVQHTCCFDADVLLLLYRQTWSWDVSVKSSHPPTHPPQAEPGETDAAPPHTSPSVQLWCVRVSVSPCACSGEEASLVTLLRTTG